MENGQLGPISRGEHDQFFNDLEQSLNPQDLNQPLIPQAEDNKPLDLENQALQDLTNQLSPGIDPIQTQLDELTNNLNNPVHRTNALAASRQTLFSATDSSKQNQFFDRYNAHADFDDHGFSPFRDNESLYNSTSSWFDEMGRAASVWDDLAGIALVDQLGLSGLTNQNFAERFADLTAIGSSSKGGVGGFTTNLFLNSAYTGGIIIETAIEEVILSIAGTALTASGFGAGLGAAMYARMGLQARKAAMLLKKAYKTSDKIMDGIDNAKKVSKAKKAFTSALKGVDNVLPGGQVRKFLRNADNVADDKLVGAFAKSLYNEYRLTKGAWNESSMEGGMLQNKMQDDLLAKFKNTEGRWPTDEEAAAIRESAKSAGVATTLMNFPAILLTEQLTLGGLYKPAASFGKTINLKAGKAFFNGSKFAEIPKSFAGKASMYLTNPKMILSSAGRYASANFAEGIQETTQESVSATNEAYFTDLYEGSMHRGSYYNYLLDGVGSQFSHEGAETFLSGFLMGGPVSAVSSTLGSTFQKMNVEGGIHETTAGKMIKWGQDKLASGADSIYNNTKAGKSNKDKFTTKLEADRKTASEAYVARENKLKKDIEVLNDVYNSNPQDFFSNVAMNLETAGALRAQIAEASKSDTPESAKIIYDAKSKLEQNWLYSILENDSLDIFKEKMAVFSEMDADELKAQGINLTPEEFTEKNTKSFEKLENMQKTYNYMKEHMPNPSNPHHYEPNDPRRLREVLLGQSWDNAVKEAVLAEADFKDILSRTKSLLKNATEDLGLGDQYYAEMSSLYNSANLTSKIAELEKERDQYKKAYADTELQEGGDLKKIIDEQNAKLDTLKNFKKAVDSYKGSKDKSTEEKVKAFNKLLPIYKKYLKNLTSGGNEHLSNNAIEKSLRAILDSHSLTAEQKVLSDAINTFLDPRGFLLQVERNKKVNEAVWNNKKIIIEKSLASYRNKMSKNALLNKLYDMGMFFDVEALTELDKSGKMPDNVYYVKAEVKEGFENEEVYVRSEDYFKAVNLLKEHYPNLNNILTAESFEANNKNVYTDFSRVKNKNDKRTLKDLEDYYGVDSAETSDSTKPYVELKPTSEEEYNKAFDNPNSVSQERIDYLANIFKTRTDGSSLEGFDQSLYSMEEVVKRVKEALNKPADKDKDYSKNKTSKKVKTKSILNKILSSPHTDERERALAAILLKHVKDDDYTTFVNDASAPGSYDPSEGPIIDLRYAASDSKIVGNTEAHNQVGEAHKNPAEHIILKQEVIRMLKNSLKTDKAFAKEIESLYMAAIKDPSFINALNRGLGRSSLGLFSAELTPDGKGVKDLESLAEFISEALTNKALQSYLQNVKYKSSKTISVWQKLVDAIVKSLKLVEGAINKGTVLNGLLFTVSAKIENITTETEEVGGKPAGNDKSKKVRRERRLKYLTRMKADTTGRYDNIKEKLFKSFRDSDVTNTFTDEELLNSQVFEDYISNTESIDQIIKDDILNNSGGSKNKIISPIDKAVMINDRGWNEAFINKLNPEKDVDEFYEYYNSGMTQEEWDADVASKISAAEVKELADLNERAKETILKIESILDPNSNLDYTIDDYKEALNNIQNEIINVDLNLKQSGKIYNFTDMVLALTKDLSFQEFFDRAADITQNRIVTSFSINEEVDVNIKNSKGVGVINEGKVVEIVTAENGKTAEISVTYTDSTGNEVTKRFMKDSLKNVIKKGASGPKEDPITKKDVDMSANSYNITSEFVKGIDTPKDADYNDAASDFLNTLCK